MLFHVQRHELSQQIQQKGCQPKSKNKPPTDLIQLTHTLLSCGEWDSGYTVVGCSRLWTNFVLTNDLHHFAYKPMVFGASLTKMLFQLAFPSSASRLHRKCGSIFGKGEIQINFNGSIKAMVLSRPAFWLTLTDKITQKTVLLAGI